MKAHLCPIHLTGRDAIGNSGPVPIHAVYFCNGETSSGRFPFLEKRLVHQVCGLIVGGDKLFLPGFEVGIFFFFFWLHFICGVETANNLRKKICFVVGDVYERNELEK